MNTTKWLIVSLGATGVKTAGGHHYDNYDAAEAMMEILDFQNPETAHLVYTVAEWEQEKADYGWQ